MLFRSGWSGGIAAGQSADSSNSTKDRPVGQSGGFGAFSLHNETVKFTVVLSMLQSMLIIDETNFAQVTVYEMKHIVDEIVCWLKQIHFCANQSV